MSRTAPPPARATAEPARLECRPLPPPALRWHPRPRVHRRLALGRNSPVGPALRRGGLTPAPAAAVEGSLASGTRGAHRLPLPVGEGWGEGGGGRCVLRGGQPSPALRAASPTGRGGVPGASRPRL